MKSLVSLLRRLAVLPIRFYRRFITPHTPPSCRFQPTCSAYGQEAVLRHGILKGGLLTAWRILRCQPFSEPGPDPVPPPGRWRAERPARMPEGPTAAPAGEQRLPPAPGELEPERTPEA